MKHTQGPWKFEDEMIRADALTGEDGNVVAEPYCMSTVDHGDEMEANAQLISAAPELLEALNGLFRECVMIHKYGGTACNQKESDLAISNAKKAMAKATG